MIGGMEPGTGRGEPRPPPSSAHARTAVAPPDPSEEVKPPGTTRIGRERGSDRGLRLAAILVVAGIGLALAKPWSWGASVATPPVASVAPSALPSAAATAAPTGPPPGLGASFGCMSDDLWTAVVDEVDAGGRSLTRSWIRIDPVAAGGPDDPGIAKVRVFAEAVPRVGFCAPTRGLRGDPGRPIAVTTWRLERDAASGRVTPIRITVAAVSGGTVRDGGALYAPPAGSDDAPSGAASDPEADWAVDAPPWRHGRWSTGPAHLLQWAQGTYVLAVEPPTVVPGQSVVRWFAIELRGPWTGPPAIPPAIAPAASPPGRPSGTPGETPDPTG